MALEAVRILINGYDETKHCDRRWKFMYAPKSSANLHQPKQGEACFTLFHIEEVVEKTTNKEDDIGSEPHFTEYTFKGFVGVNSKFDKQFDDELEEEKKAAGKYEQYIKPLHECFAPAFTLDICEGFVLIYFQKKDKINYLDQGYDGLELSFKLKKYWM